MLYKILENVPKIFKCSNISMAVEALAKTFLQCWLFYFTLAFISVILFDNILLYVLMINNSLTLTPERLIYFFIFCFNLANEVSQKQSCISTVTLVCQCGVMPTLWSRVNPSSPEVEMKSAPLVGLMSKHRFNKLKTSWKNVSGKHRSLITEWHSDIK